MLMSWSDRASVSLWLAMPLGPMDRRVSEFRPALLAADFISSRSRPVRRSAGARWPGSTRVARYGAYQRGHRYGLCGENGKGKSTLMRAINKGQGSHILG